MSSFSHCQNRSVGGEGRGGLSLKSEPLGKGGEIGGGVRAGRAMAVLEWSTGECETRSTDPKMEQKVQRYIGTYRFNAQQ